MNRRIACPRCSNDITIPLAIDSSRKDDGGLTLTFKLDRAVLDGIIREHITDVCEQFTTALGDVETTRETASDLR